MAKHSLSNTVCKVYTPDIFSANEAPPETTIFLYHEMAYPLVYQSRLFYFCQKPRKDEKYNFVAPMCLENGSRKSCPDTPKFV